MFKAKFQIGDMIWRDNDVYLVMDIKDVQFHYGLEPYYTLRVISRKDVPILPVIESQTSARSVDLKFSLYKTINYNKIWVSLNDRSI